MNILKDYIAYARSYVNPKLSEEAAQYLIQAYVGKKFRQFRDMGRHRGAVVGSLGFISLGEGLRWLCHCVVSLDKKLYVVFLYQGV